MMNSNLVRQLLCYDQTRVEKMSINWLGFFLGGREGGMRRKSSDCDAVWDLYALGQSQFKIFSLNFLAWSRISVEQGFRALLIWLILCVYFESEAVHIFFLLVAILPKKGFTLGEKSGYFLLGLSKVTWNNWELKENSRDRQEASYAISPERGGMG